MSVRVTSKGQVTIPKHIRQLLGIRRGSAVEFNVDPDGRVTLCSGECSSRVHTRFARVRGKATVRMSTEQIMALTRGEA